MTIQLPPLPTLTQADKYRQFLERKTHVTGNFGFEPLWLPDSGFDFQKHIIAKAVRKGRMGLFVDTGLGKTMQELSIAQNIVLKTNKRVLILTPLAVAFQFIDEAARIGIHDIEHSRDGKFTKKIVVCNYERLHLFNPDDFICVIPDESSILKNFAGKTRDQIVTFIKKVPYRFLATATPSPNDFIELGNSSEALGYMGYMDMLTKFFKSNQSSADSNARVGEKFHLKAHAEKDFFAWVNQWAIMVKMPSDLGYSDDGYVLPGLHVNSHLVDGTGEIGVAAKRLTDQRLEQKATVSQRCERAVQLAADKTSVYWCNLNEEGEALQALDPSAMEISGAMSVDRKEEILVAFAKGQVQRLITKAKMTSMGLNWQHCNHTVFFPTYSYEQYYQAIRRFHRFGQTQEVTCDMVVSGGQGRMLLAIEEKRQKAIALHANLVAMANRSYTAKITQFDKSVQLPSFLK